MFSPQQKKHIANEIEKVLLSLDHPEMPKSHPVFQIHIDGAESWSWADIVPNWVHEQMDLKFRKKDSMTTQEKELFEEFERKNNELAAQTKADQSLKRELVEALRATNSVLNLVLNRYTDDLREAEKIAILRARDFSKDLIARAEAQDAHE